MSSTLTHTSSFLKIATGLHHGAKLWQVFYHSMSRINTCRIGKPIVCALLIISSTCINYHLWFMHGLKQRYHLNLFAAHFSHKVLTMVAKRMLQKLILVPLCKNLKRPQFHFGGFLSTGVCLTDCGYDWRCFVWGDEQKQETHASHCVCHATQFNLGWLWIWLRYLKVRFIRIVQNRIE